MQEAKAQIARDKTRVLYVARERERQAEKGSALDRLAARITKGPLMLLRRCYERRMAVRVVTRHAHGVRGVATGTSQPDCHNFAVQAQVSPGI